MRRALTLVESLAGLAIISILLTLVVGMLNQSGATTAGNEFGSVVDKQKFTNVDKSTNIGTTRYFVTVSLRENEVDVSVSHNVYSSLKSGDKVKVSVKKGAIFGDKLYEYAGKQATTAEAKQ